MGKALKTVVQIHSLLKQFGITRVVFSPGSRHLPLIHLLEQDSDFELYNVTDERSAAFFALGLIQQTGQPVVVSCTSGTACINLASAVIEAYYQRLPLLVISGDRYVEYLNQDEDQQYDQIQSFKGYTKYQALLPRIDSDIDEWYTNRVINEALIELTHHGNGPVHIDFPVGDPFGEVFELDELPRVRKISLETAECSDTQWKKYAEFLSGKKIAVVWGQSVFPSMELEEAAEAFARTYDAVFLTDYMSNCRLPHAIKNVPRMMRVAYKVEEREAMFPDVVIRIGANTIFNYEMKALVKQGDVTFWQVGKEDKVIDGFRKLTQIFEMSESYFFGQMAKHAALVSSSKYFSTWKRLEEESVRPHSDKFDEMRVIEELINSLPNNSDLQIANSWSTRMSQLMDIPNGVRVNCNRGVNGIDGSMSTAMGFAASNSERMSFLIIGDLSFFYDMNSLGIKHVGSNVRILLINNNGGSMLYKPFMQQYLDKGLPMSNLGLGKRLTAKGWVESLGFEYISATSLTDYEEGIERLTCEKSDKPIVLEAFTNYYDDQKSYTVGQMDRRDLSDKMHLGINIISKKLGFKK